LRVYQQFQLWTTILKAASREQILRQIRGEKLSATRKKMLKQALEG